MSRSQPQQFGGLSMSDESEILSALILAEFNKNITPAELLLLRVAW